MIGLFSFLRPLDGPFYLRPGPRSIAGPEIAWKMLTLAAAKD